MFNHSYVPPVFNGDAVVNHEKMTEEINIEMERLEVLQPCISRGHRKDRREKVYNKIRRGYKTYKETYGESK